VNVKLTTALICSGTMMFQSICNILADSYVQSAFWFGLGTFFWFYSYKKLYKPV